MANFINPYNFVPLAKDAPSRKSREEVTQELKGQELYTGKIQYSMETLSPLFIPNTSNDRILGVKGVDDKKDAYHKSYDFFSYHDLSNDTDPNACYEPVLPGSEIRGMVRSVYEVLTNSCLSAVDEGAVLSKRTAEHFEAGVLMKKGDGYQLYAAKDYLYRAKGNKDFSVHNFEDSKLPRDGSHVYFSVDRKSASGRPPYAKPFACNISSQKNSGMKDGYLIKGESGPEIIINENSNKKSKCFSCPDSTQKKCKANKETTKKKKCYFLEKHCAHVFEIVDKDYKNKRNSGQKTGIEPVRTMTKTEVEDVNRRMDKLLVIYGNNREQKGMYSEYRETWEEFKENDESKGIAVYYSIVTDANKSICYLSPACITREIYRNTLKDILDKYCTCGDADNVCAACRLFGIVNRKSKLQIASRLRFSDAYVTGKKEKDTDYYDKPLTLPELSTPKLSSAEFYLQRPDDKNVLNWTYDYYVTLEADNSTTVKTYMPSISGRKFYWHSPQTVDWVRSMQTKIEKNERNKTVRPVSKGIAFQGEVYFDGITGEELDDLIRILNLSSLEEEGKYALKLGSGKPFGLGSVSMKIKQVVFRTVSLDEKARLVYKADNSYSYQSVGLTQEIHNTGILKLLNTHALESEHFTDDKMHYPYVDKSEPGDEEGFVWFTNNRVGKWMNNKTKLLDINQTDAAPKSRTQILYREYMQPLKPELVSNKTRDKKQ